MQRFPLTPLSLACSAVLVATACGGGATVDDDVSGGQSTADGSLTAGYVSAIDQLGLPVATEIGHFEDHGLNVTLADPFPTGVDAINALEAGEVDIIQVGVPGLVAVSEGVDLVFVGNYSGSSTQRSIDETMGIVASEDSDIDPEDLSTLEGATIGTSVGTINHLYLLSILKDLRIDVDDVELVNTAPPDMPVALETGGVDATVNWDPWPITIEEQVEGAYEVVRGGGYIPYVGYIATTPDYLEENPEMVEAFLAARAASDQWIRQNPEEAADTATRWLTGTDLEVAQTAMEFNIAQLDARFSACNFLAMDTVANLLEEQEVISYDFDINDHLKPTPILSVEENHPELFDDLAETPNTAEIESDHSFVREVDQDACAV
ncbi:ABC transporter substrate-binding protein [Nocardiopsis sp. NPDC006938]|uniref:ABC transporter substrate-binding protein n=1 Tax=Nocardiopsis sp. NPDC006938 TaxID=3364337 RepID=UPI003675E616